VFIGYREDAYLAQIDGQHALHCLNAVRRYAHREYYFPNVKSNDSITSSPFDALNKAHLSHCLYILLQTLSCSPSVDVITHNWMNTQHYPFPDFTLNKKCTDHNVLLDWQKSNRISQGQWADMAWQGPAPGEPVMELPPLMSQWGAETEDANAGTGHHHKYQNGNMFSVLPYSTSHNK
jgi:hypothetical protein